MIVITRCGYGVTTFCSRMIPHAFYINAWSYAGRKVNWLILHGSRSASLTIPESSSPFSHTSRHHFVFSRTRYLALPLQYDGCRYSRSQIVPRNTKRHHLARRLRGCIQVPPRLLRTPFSPLLFSSFSSLFLFLSFLARIFYLHCRSSRGSAAPRSSYWFRFSLKIRANVV